MNLRSRCVPVIVSLVFLVGCKAALKTTLLTPADSLAWDEGNHGNITLLHCMAAKDDELYMSDDSDSIYVYGMSTGQWVRTFGGHGEGPGRFNVAEDMTFLANGNLLVADMFNMRLQEITPQGEYVTSTGVMIPNVVRADGDDVYYANYIGIKDSGLYRLLPDGTGEQLFNMNKWQEEKGIKETWRFDILPDYFLITIFQNMAPFLISRTGEIQDVAFPKPYETSFDYFWGQAKPYRKGFIVPFMYYTRDMSEEQEMKDGDVCSCLVYYGMDGSILHTYDLPAGHAVVYPASWVLQGNRAYLEDYLSGVVYAYDLENK